MSEKRLPELSPEAQDIIGAAEHDGPSDADRSRVRASVLAAIAGGTAVTATTAAEAVTSSAGATSASAAGVGAVSMGLATKLIIGAALVVGVGAGLYAAKATSDSSPSPTATTTPSLSAAQTTPPPAASQTRNSATTPEAVAEAGSPVASVTKTPRAVAPTPSAEPAVRERVKATRAKATPAAPTASNSGSDELAQLEQERALLDVATKALRNGKPARALEVLSESTTLFPKPLLAQERRATRILALCAVGRAKDARAAAEKFRERYPSSAHLTRIDRACASL